MAVVLAIDTSGSMLARSPSGNRSIDAVKEAAAAFISLLSAGDRIALFTFDNETELRLDFTDDHRSAINAVRRISATPEAFTRLYDTALAAVKKAAEFPRGRRAVILLTDGRDEKRGGLPSTRCGTSSTKQQPGRSACRSTRSVQARKSTGRPWGEFPR
jgi:Mg-chelatase subunit ChlD